MLVRSRLTTGIVAQRPGQLAVTHVDGIDLYCAILQHAVGKAPSGGPNIAADFAGQIQMELGHSLFSFKPPRLTYLRVSPRISMVSSAGNIGSGFVGFLAVDINLPGHDDAFGPFPAGDQSLFHQRDVQPLFTAILL